MSNTTPLLSIKGITKRFTGITAVDHVSFDIHKNEVHALIGENGAGKSTLCKMLTGAYSIDEGHIEIDGKKVNFKGPADSMKEGINMVYQERNLIGYMTAAQNISLGTEVMKGIIMDQKAIMKRAEDVRERLGVDVPLDVPVEKLGAGEILLTSMDCDGTKAGYDLELTRAVAEAVNIPVIASGGAGNLEHFYDALTDGKADAALAASLFHYKELEIKEVKEYLRGRGVSVRL